MYFYQGIFAVIRIILCFYFLFFVLAPLFLPAIKKENSIDRLMYSWVGLGGLILLDVFILTVLNLYDFISLFTTLVLIPLLVYFFKRWKAGNSIRDVLISIEISIISQHVRVIESTVSFYDSFKKKLTTKPSINYKDSIHQYIAILFATIAAVIRIIPALKNSAPFTRNWYFELQSVKAISLQQYFTVYPDPNGLHAFVNVFSTLSQISPEMILHILGALTSFFLALMIFWVLNFVTDFKNQVASLIGMSIYSITPMYLTPVILELEVEANAISLALCFAIPTFIFFLRQLKDENKIYWFYIIIGILGTSLINIFVFIIVLLPLLILSLFTLDLKKGGKNLFKPISIILITYILGLSPYIVFSLFNNIGILEFFQRELFDTLIFSYFPNLVLYLDELSMFYIGIALVLIIINFMLIRIKKISSYKEIFFLVLFALTAYVYTPYFPFAYTLIDPDQLNLFYAFTISIFIGLIFLTISRIYGAIFDKSRKVFHFVNISFAILFIVGGIYIQNGILLSRALPETLPNGFFDAYYKIVSERVPYTYATVSPELDRTLAKNRHYFMNYEFFLDNYGTIDSLYQLYLLAPIIDEKVKEIPPASIFLFLEKPPYTSIQQGILYNSQGTMFNMEQWVENFSIMKGRNINVYYENDNSIVYEIINRENESRISSVLKNVFPAKKEDDELN